MKNRLIKLVGESTGVVYDGDVIAKEEIDITEGEIERIVDHLLANGVIAPPCKVGQMIYVVDVCARGIIERMVTGIRQNEWKTIYIHSFGFGYPDSSIGKTVFLTKEEAEKAIKECES